MDFSNRNVQQPANAHPAAPAAASPASAGGSKKNKGDKGKWGRIGLVSIVAAVVIIIVAVIVLVTTAGPKPAAKYVDNNKLQAVFLNTGQVYFGNITALNSKYYVLTNIYYLQTNNANGSSSSSNSSANTSVTLVKLGCELHEPYDQMVLNSDQVTFWENLQDNGQVAKAVATFQKQNPNGQKCTDQSSSASTNSSTSAQNAGNSSTPASTTPATTTPATKP